jgi:hypothetical protein
MSNAVPPGSGTSRPPKRRMKLWLERDLGVRSSVGCLSRPEPTWRRTSPHAFGNDGRRWHVRAYCHGLGFRGCTAFLRRSRMPVISGAAGQYRGRLALSRRGALHLSAHPGATSPEPPRVCRTGRLSSSERTCSWVALKQPMITKLCGGSVAILLETLLFCVIWADR